MNENPLLQVVAALTAAQQRPALPVSRPPAQPRPFQGLGMLEPGNIDLYRQPVVKNPDGTTSTVDSFSVNFDGREVLLPTVTPDGRHLSIEEAIREFERAGRHLGMFQSPEFASDYGQRLHNEYARGVFDKGRR